MSFSDGSDMFRFKAVSRGVRPVFDYNSLWLKRWIWSHIYDKEYGIVQFSVIEDDDDTGCLTMLEPKVLGVYRDGDSLCMAMNGKAIKPRKLSSTLLTSASCTYMLLTTSDVVRAYAIKHDGKSCELFEIFDVEKIEYLTSGKILGRVDTSNWSSKTKKGTVFICP